MEQGDIKILLKEILVSSEYKSEFAGLFMNGVNDETMHYIFNHLLNSIPNLNRIELNSSSISSLSNIDKNQNYLVVCNCDSFQILNNIDSILKYLILPKVYSGERIYFLSKFNLQKPKKSISIDNLHNDYKTFTNLLKFEQLLNLLQKYCFSIDSETGKVVHPLNRNNLNTIKNKYFESILDPNLDSYQKTAVSHLKGPIIVHSPAGSGKTRTIVNRIIFLLSRGIPSSKILAVAFNKKAAEEMKTRLVSLDILDVNVRTLHSIAYEIVRDKFGWKFEDKSENEKYNSIINLIDSSFNPGSGIISLISNSKMNLEHIDKIKEKYRHLEFNYPEFFFTFINKQFETGIFTFDDMIYFALYALINDSSIRKLYQKRFDFVLVDEFQDLNNAQLEMCKILAMPENNLYVVGDDDQMIYSWRGANIDHIINFYNENHLCKQITLNTNYRSALMIVNHSKLLIENNRVRTSKNINCFRSNEKGTIEIFKGKNLVKQAEKIGNWVLKNKTATTNWSDFGILCRFNIHRLPIALQLDKMNIPFSPIEYEKLFEDDIAAEVLRYLSIVSGKGDYVSRNIQITLFNFFPGIPLNILKNITSLDDISKIITEFKEIKHYYTNLSELKAQYTNGKLNSVTLLKEILKHFKIEEKFRQRKKNNPESETLDIVIDSLFSLADSYPDIDRLIKIIEFPPQRNQEQQNVVYLSTIHRTKGNEFKNVAIFNYSDDIDIDSVRVLEEERRVFYVGVTRAIDRLLITTHKKNPSPFIKELSL